MSKIAGIQLTKGNSGIVDLGDVNRPTKLAEKWSSLYTDEWTEAFDQLSLDCSIKNEDCKFEKELCNIAMVHTNDCYFLSKHLPFISPDPTFTFSCSSLKPLDQLKPNWVEMFIG